MARRAAAAVVLGIVLLVGGWSARSEPALQSCELLLQTSTSACEHLTPAQSRSLDRRVLGVEAATWTAMVLGGLLLLGGWTVARELDGEHDDGEGPDARTGPAPRGTGPVRQARTPTS